MKGDPVDRRRIELGDPSVPLPSRPYHEAESTASGGSPHHRPLCREWRRESPRRARQEGVRSPPRSADQRLGRAPPSWRRSSPACSSILPTASLFRDAAQAASRKADDRQDRRERAVRKATSHPNSRLRARPESRRRVRTRVRPDSGSETRDARGVGGGRYEVLSSKF
jgi:hypothetical protein